MSQIDASAIVGMVSPMLAIAEPYARFRLIWMRPFRADRAAASVSGSSTSAAMITPTNDCGRPATMTACSTAGDSSSARPTTATRAQSSSTRLLSACRLLGGSAWLSSSNTRFWPRCAIGRKKSRCRTVWVNTNSRYTKSVAIAAKASWLEVNSLPGCPVVKAGRTRLSVATVVTVASAAPAPSALNSVTP